MPKQDILIKIGRAKEFKTSDLGQNYDIITFNAQNFRVYLD